MNTNVGKNLVHDKFGNPKEVLKVTETSIEKPAANEVTVKWLLSPINPSDVVCIQGNWPIKPTLPTCPGNEGVGEIVAIGRDILDLKIGDRVLSQGSALGTWRTLKNYQRNQVMPISKNLSLEAACILKINPCTAYRLLKDFVQLKEGDTVIQNAANSVVGQMVIQLCLIWNYKTVNIVRNRPNIKELKEKLISLGANQVLTEDELLQTNIFKNNILLPPKLALDCVGGESTLNLLKRLDQNGILVCYGCLSKKNMIVSPYDVRYKNLTVKGFWLTEWSKKNASLNEREQMFEELTEFFIRKKLKVPDLKRIDLNNYTEAFSNYLNSDEKTESKLVFDMTNF